MKNTDKEYITIDTTRTSKRIFKHIGFEFKRGNYSGIVERKDLIKRILNES